MSNSSSMPPRIADLPVNVAQLKEYFPRAMVELLRRVLLVGGALLAICLFLMPAEALYEVRGADFAQKHKSRTERLGAGLARAGNATGIDVSEDVGRIKSRKVEDYIAEQTRDRLAVVSGQAWEEFFKSARTALSGESGPLKDCYSSRSYVATLYCPVAMHPLDSLRDRFTGKESLVYVMLQGRPIEEALTVSFRRPQEISRYATRDQLFPRWKLAPVALGVGILGYIFLPWARRRPYVLMRSRGSSCITPDILGVVLGGLFFALPFLVILENSTGAQPFSLFNTEDGWAWLTAILWMFTIGCMGMTFTSLWYASSALAVGKTGLIWRTLFGTRQCEYSRITSVAPAVWQLPGWLRLICFLAAFLNWRMAGALMGTSQSAGGIRITLENGSNFRIMTDHLPGSELLLEAMKAAGVPMDPVLLEQDGQDE